MTCLSRYFFCKCSPNRHCVSSPEGTAAFAHSSPTNAVLLVTSVLAARAYGMIGFAWASLGANSLRVAAVIILGLVKAGKDKGGSNADR